MKFIYITCNVSMLETISDLLDELKFTDYQVIEQVTTKSSYASPRLNTAIWPGYNSSIVIQEIDDEKVTSLKNIIDEMNSSAFNNEELIALYAWSIDAFTQVKKVE